MLKNFNVDSFKKIQYDFFQYYVCFEVLAQDNYGLCKNKNFLQPFLPKTCEPYYIRNASLFRKIVSPFSTNPNFYTTLTALINKLKNASPNDPPHTNLIDNWTDINTCK